MIGRSQATEENVNVNVNAENASYRGDTTSIQYKRFSFGLRFYHRVELAQDELVFGPHRILSRSVEKSRPRRTRKLH